MAAGLRQLTDRERAIVGEFRAQHGAVRGLALPIADVSGAVAAPLYRHESVAVRPAGGRPRLLEADRGLGRGVVRRELAQTPRMAERHPAPGAPSSAVNTRRVSPSRPTAFPALYEIPARS